MAIQGSKRPAVEAEKAGKENAYFESVRQL
jgi:hypothetical protein